MMATDIKDHPRFGVDTQYWVAFSNKSEIRIDGPDRPKWTFRKASDSLKIDFNPPEAPSPRQEAVIGVKADDLEMATAIAKACETLTQFWEIFDKREHSETDFSLKAKVTDENGTEHVWLVSPERKDGTMFGTIGNDLKVVKNIKLGDRIQVPDQNITDWGYMHDGRMFGKFTLRVLLKRMPAAEAAMYRKLLADP